MRVTRVMSRFPASIFKARTHGLSHSITVFVNDRHVRGGESSACTGISLGVTRQGELITPGAHPLSLFTFLSLQRGNERRGSMTKLSWLRGRGRTNSTHVIFRRPPFLHIFFLPPRAQLCRLPVAELASQLSSLVDCLLNEREHANIL